MKPPQNDLGFSAGIRSRLFRDNTLSITQVTGLDALHKGYTPMKATTWTFVEAVFCEEYQFADSDLDKKEVCFFNISTKRSSFKLLPHLEHQLS